MTHIDPIHTPCKSCVFAQYENNTQTGCALNYIDKYRDAGVEILEAYDDDDNNFYVLNKKKCLGYRESKWFEELNMTDSSMEDKIEYFYKNNAIQYIIIIDLKDYDINKLENIFNQILNATVRPTKLVLIRHQHQTEFKYEHLEKLINACNIDFEWRIQSMIDNDLSYIEILHNIIMTNPKYRFVIAVEKFTEDLTKMIDTTNRIVYKDLKQFLVLTTPDKNCLSFSSIVYRYSAVTNDHIFKDPDKFQVI